MANSYQAFFIPGIFVSLGTRAMMNFLGLPFRASVFVLDCFAVIAVAFFQLIEIARRSRFSRPGTDTRAYRTSVAANNLLIELNFY
jgi:hypothetical protein